MSAERRFQFGVKVLWKGHKYTHCVLRYDDDNGMVSIVGPDGYPFLSYEDDLEPAPPAREIVELVEAFELLAPILRQLQDGKADDISMNELMRARIAIAKACETYCPR